MVINSYKLTHFTMINYQFFFCGFHSDLSLQRPLQAFERDPAFAWSPRDNALQNAVKTSATWFFFVPKPLKKHSSLNMLGIAVGFLSSEECPKEISVSPE